MSTERVDFYRIVCDWPECGRNAHHDEGSEYSAWGDEGEARIDADNSGWHRGVDEKDYCTRHLTLWASDIKVGETLPNEPFLLVHDGDTADSDDDGKVSLISTQGVTP